MSTIKTYAGYKEILIAKLQAITTVVGEGTETLFAGVYGYNKTDNDGTPIAYVVEEAGAGQILDTHRNEREWQFHIALHQTFVEGGQQAAYEALLDAVDRVITSFDQDPMLRDVHGEGQCKWIKVLPVAFEYANQDVAVHRALLTVAVVDVVNRYASS